MADPVAFYFDFSSPYGYLGACTVEAAAARHGRGVDWHPILLGAVMKETGMRPLSDIPLKSDYMRRDMVRAARLLDIPFAWPAPFPIPTLAAARAFYWRKDRDEAAAVALAKALYAAYFADGQNISEPAVVLDVAATHGIDREALGAALGDPGIKARLKDETAGAMAAGVFGSPYYLVDGEPFWGHDRLADLERWLETGGW